jgi:hypothetical protein
MTQAILSRLILVTPAARVPRGPAASGLTLSLQTKLYGLTADHFACCIPSSSVWAGIIIEPIAPGDITSGQSDVQKNSRR